MRVLLALTALAAAVLVAVPALGSDPPQPPTPTTEAPAKADPCEGQRFTQDQHRRYAEKVYERDKVSKAARKRLSRLAQCQHTPEASANAKRLQHKLAKKRKHRLKKGACIVGRVSVFGPPTEGGTGQPWKDEVPGIAIRHLPKGGWYDV